MLDVFFVVEPDASRDVVLGWMAELRRRGVSCDTDYAGRSLRGQLTQAGRVGARTTVIVSADAATLRRRSRGRTDPPRRDRRHSFRISEWRDLMCGEPRDEHVGRRVALSGWVARRRDHGGLVFVDLRDRTGVTQLVVNPERSPSAAAAAHELRNEFVVRADGEVVARSPETVNPEMAHRHGRAAG